MDPHFSPRPSKQPQLPATTTTTSATQPTSSSEPSYSIINVIVSFFVNNQASQEQQQQRQQQPDWQANNATNSNRTHTLANSNDYQENPDDNSSSSSLAGRDNEFMQPLMGCVESLFKNEATHKIVQELLDSAQTDKRSPPPSAFNDSVSAAAAASSAARFPAFMSHQSPAAALLGADNHTFSLNESMINWTKLNEKLPATESNYQLEALSEKWQFYLALIYSLTAITSFILNMVTVIVLIRSRRSELRKYLINLSLSDLLMSLFSIPFTYTEYMLGHWIFASFLCPVVRLVVTLSVFVSVATMTVIGINRHLAIMYPLKRKKYSKFRRWTIRKTHVIIAIWLLGIAISLPEFLMYSTQPFCYNRQLFFECRQSWPNSMANSYTIFIYMSTFVVPFSLLTYLYTCIGFKLWRREMPGNIDVNRDLTMQTQRTKVIKMLLVVVVLFATFWLPLQTFSLVTFLYPNLREGIVYQSLEYNIFIGTYFVSHWLSMAHSCLNPLIYCFMNDKFRDNLHSLICVNNKRHVSSLYSYSISRITQHSSYFKQSSSNQVPAAGANNSKCSNERTQSCDISNNDDFSKADGRSSSFREARRKSSSSETKTKSEKYHYYSQQSDEKQNNHQIIEHHHFHHYNQQQQQRQQQGRRRSSLLSNDSSTNDGGRAEGDKANSLEKPKSQIVEVIEKPEAVIVKQKSALSFDRTSGGSSRNNDMLKLVDLLNVDGQKQQQPQSQKNNGEQVFMRIIEQAESEDEATNDDDAGDHRNRPSARHVNLLSRSNSDANQPMNENSTHKTITSNSRTDV